MSYSYLTSYAKMFVNYEAVNEIVSNWNLFSTTYRLQGSRDWLRPWNGFTRFQLLQPGFHIHYVSFGNNHGLKRVFVALWYQES